MAGEIEVLEELGLSANEAKLYLILVQIGSMKANELAVKSGLQRRTVYDTMRQLEKKGMAGTAKVSGVMTFSPAPPSSLLSFIEEKRDAADRLLPLLSKPFEAGNKTSVSVLYGKSGIKMVMEDIISLRSDYYACYGQLQFFESMPKSMRLFNEKRVKYGLKAKYLLLDVPTARKHAQNFPLADIKFIDPSVISAGVWWTYADRLVLFVLEGEPVTIFIKNADLAQTFQKTFLSLFDSNARTYHGLKGIEAVLEQTLVHKEMLFMGGAGQVPLRLPEYVQNYRLRAQKVGMKWHNLAHRSIMKHPQTHRYFDSIRLLPKDWESNPNVIWIFGDCVANVVWREEPVLFLIEDRAIAQAYRNYFWLLWKMARKK